MRTSTAVYISGMTIALVLAILGIGRRETENGELRNKLAKETTKVEVLESFFEQNGGVVRTYPDGTYQYIFPTKEPKKAKKGAK